MKTCQFGVYGACGDSATTKRQRPSGEELWDVCEEHAGRTQEVASTTNRQFSHKRIG